MNLKLEQEGEHRPRLEYHHDDRRALVPGALEAVAFHQAAARQLMMLDFRRDPHSRTPVLVLAGLPDLSLALRLRNHRMDQVPGDLRRL